MFVDMEWKGARKTPIVCKIKNENKIWKWVSVSEQEYSSLKKSNWMKSKSWCWLSTDKSWLSYRNGVKPCRQFGFICPGFEIFISEILFVLLKTLKMTFKTDVSKCLLRVKLNNPRISFLLSNKETIPMKMVQSKTLEQKIGNALLDLTQLIWNYQKNLEELTL